MRDFLFDDVERNGLDIYDADDPAASRLSELLSANLEEHKGDYAIVADLLDAIVRYRHLIHEVNDQGFFAKDWSATDVIGMLNVLTKERDAILRISTKLRDM